MIEINEPIILATKQFLEVVGYTMIKDEKGWCAVIDVSIKNESNKRIDVKRFYVPYESWNGFWKDFNSGTYLYQKFGNATDSENEFVNSSG